MINFKSIFLFIATWLQIFASFIRPCFMTNISKDLEIIALRSQLSILQQDILNDKIHRPRVTPAFRQLWVLLSKFFPDWKSSLLVVKPETVVGWHKTAFKHFWMMKSKKSGRPKISRATIALIKRIHKENPLLSPEKIHERLVNLEITDTPPPNTITKYIPNIRKPPTKKQMQSWKTFLTHHRKDIWAMYFFTFPTLHFKVLYILIIISHDRRKIEHFQLPQVHHQYGLHSFLHFYGYF